MTILIDRIDYHLLLCFLVLLSIAIFVVLRPLKKQTGGVVMTTMFALLLFILPIAGYMCWGSWFAWKDYQNELTKQEQVNTMLKSVEGNPQKLMDKLKERLRQQPESARGWYLLGRLYGSQNQWSQARDAFMKAHQLKPESERVTINYAQSLWQLNNRQFNEDIRGLFQSVLKTNANQPDALAMLAMDAFLRHAYKQAIDYWQHLLDIIPPQSDDALAIRKAIAKAQQEML